VNENPNLKWYSFRWRLFLANSLESAQRTINRHRLRFSLAGLLLAMAAISLFLGYAQWRRQTLLRQAKELEAYGFRLQLRDRWANLIWPEVAKEATFASRYLEDGRKVAGSKTYNRPNGVYAMMLDHRILFARLDALGVENCDIEENGKITARAWVKAHVTAEK
jgi:hypothetical protein